MIDSAEDVAKSHPCERSRGLVPFGIQSDQAGVAALVLERANRSVGREEPEDGQDTQPKSVESRMQRESRLVRLNAVIEQDVQRSLIGQEIRILGNPRPEPRVPRPIP